MTSGSLGFLALPSSSDHSEQKPSVSNLPGHEVVVLGVASLIGKRQSVQDQTGPSALPTPGV